MRRWSTLTPHAVDALTVLVVVLAVYIALLPGSQIRTAWAKHRSESGAKSAAKRLWSEIANVSSPLFTGNMAPDLVEASDYECPFCRSAQLSVDSAGSAGVRIAFLHVPSRTRPHAARAAVAAMCAENAGRFREMNARLMSTEKWRSDTNWLREAQFAGVTDLRAFEDCMDSQEVRRRLAHHLALAESLRVRATPTFLSPEAYFLGTISTAKLLRMSGRR
jgi:protein-disulfide isomerase